MIQHADLRAAELRMYQAQLLEVVYRFYSDADELLYVGRTSNFLERVRDHDRSTPWWNEVKRFEVDGPFGVDIARLVERDQIGNLAPLYNKNWNWRRGWHGSKYHPDRDQFVQQDGRRSELIWPVESAA